MAEPPERRPRPAARARRLEDPPPTVLSERLVAICASGERAVTVMSPPAGGPSRAALGSPVDPEAFAVWRTQGVSVFHSGPVPPALTLDVGPGARLVVTTS